MKKLKIRKETLIPLDRRFQQNEAAGGIRTVFYHTADTSMYHF
jgi:hypothetical protein